MAAALCADIDALMIRLARFQPIDVAAAGSIVDRVTTMLVGERNGDVVFALASLVRVNLARGIVEVRADSARPHPN